MARIVTRPEWMRQPTRRVDINWQHSLSQGLVAAIVPVGNVAVDLVTGVLATRSAASAVPSTLAGDWGSSYLLNNVAGTGHLTFPAQALALDRFSGAATVMVEGGPSANTLSNAFVFRSGESSNGRGIGMAFDDASSQTNSITAYADNTAQAPAAGDYLGTSSELKIHRCGFSLDGTNVRFYTKGRLQETTAYANTPTTDAARQTQVFGFWSTASNSGLKSRFSLILVWSRAWVGNEYAALYPNFYQVFRRTVGRSYFFTASAQTAAVSTATETDTALGLGKVKLRATGVATETDTALGLGKVKVRATGLATGTDAALALGTVKVRATGVATETDTALGLSKVKVHVTGVGTGTDAVLNLARLKVLALTRSDETDTALALAGVRPNTVGVATGTDSALALGKVKIRATGLATVTNTALALGAVKVRALGVALETDAALALATAGHVATGTALETDTALALARKKIRACGTALETDVAKVTMTFTVRRANGTDTALALGAVKKRATGLSPSFVASGTNRRQWRGFTESTFS